MNIMITLIIALAILLLGLACLTIPTVIIALIIKNSKKKSNTTIDSKVE